MGNKIALKKKPPNSDSFIIEHNKSTRNKPIIDISASSFDQRRIIFISLLGLYETFDKCPSAVLYSAICFIPLKKNWIYHPKRYMSEIKQRYEVFSLLNKDCPKRSQFIKFLKWKHSQGLVIWQLDEQFSAETWRTLSAKLVTLYDPITGKNYKPIIFEHKFWTQIYNKNSDHSSEYSAKSHSILLELYCLSISMKYKPLQEIIYQSNPESLNPVISYHCLNNSPSTFNNATINGDDGWKICCDYET